MSQLKNTVLSVVKDSYSTQSEVMFNAYVASRYNLSLEALKIKHKDLDAVIANLVEAYPLLNNTHFPLTILYDYYVLESDDLLVTFDTYDNKEKIQVNIYFQSHKDGKKAFDLVKEFEDTDDELFVNISSYFLDNQKNIKSLDTMKVQKDFTYNNSDYYPYIDTDEMFRQYMMSDSNILLLCGEPGVGKSKLGDSFMKFLLELRKSGAELSKSNLTKEIHETIHIADEDGDIETTVQFESKEFDGVKVAYVKNEEILAQDVFWNILKEEEYQLVFLDDLDYGLLPRTQAVSSGIELDKNKFISNLLSFTDGIFDAGNKTKFIVTTNRDVGDIDTAVLRKGRTFDILQLRKLKREEALVVWKHEFPGDSSEDDFESEFNTAEHVLQADLGSAINIRKKAAEANRELSPYILEDNISLYEKSKHKKKIGL